MQKQTSKSTWVWMLLAAGVVALMLIRGSGRRAPSGVEHPAVGNRFPALRVRGLTGADGHDPQGNIALRDLRGKVVLLNLWGPWCPNCLDELPELAQIDQDFGSDADFQLIAVSYPNLETDYERLQSDTQACLDRLGLNIPTYIDDVGLTSTSVGHVIGNPRHGFPATLVLDREGKVQGVWRGYSPRAVQQMRSVIDELLANPSTDEAKSEAAAAAG